MEDMMINILQYPRHLSVVCHPAGNSKFPCRSASPRQSDRAFIYFFSNLTRCSSTFNVPRIRKNRVGHCNFPEISSKNRRVRCLEKEKKFVRRMKQMTIPDVKLKLERICLKSPIQISFARKSLILEDELISLISVRTRNSTNACTK